jgi:hypothetical protein
MFVTSRGQVIYKRCKQAYVCVRCSGSGAQGPSALLTAAGFSAPAVPLLLQGHWLLLLQWALVALIMAACWHPQAALRILTFLADCAQSLLTGA